MPRMRRSVNLASWLLVGTVSAQSSSSVNAAHSGVPSPFPNPYYNPHNNISWIQKYNQSWYNSTVPNSPWGNATDSNGNYEAAYSPGRAPAFPLAVRTPYTSAWASTANNGSLNSQFPVFWDGSSLGWEGIVTVDGISYEWMGVGSESLPELDYFQSASPISTVYDSSYTNFTFAAGPVELTASFFSPVTPSDLCRQSIPLSYLSVSVASKDGNTHNVSLYTDVNGGWVTQPAAPLEWLMYEGGQTVNGSNVTTSSSAIYTWIVQLQDQYEFGEQYGQAAAQANQGVFPFWGNFTWSSSQGPAQSIKFQSGYAVNQRFKYVNGVGLSNTVDTDYRSFTEMEPVYAYEHQLGYIGAGGSGDVVFTIGMVNTPSIRLLSKVGIESLQPWWLQCYGSFFDMIYFHFNDLVNVKSLAAAFEYKLKEDINTYYGNPDNNTVNGQGASYPAEYYYNGTQGTVEGVDQYGQQYIFNSGDAYGYLEPANECNSTGIAIPEVSEEQSYYAIVALAARQVLAGYVLTEPSITANTTSEPYAFQKEISSNGNVNTVDVIFPAMPFFLWANPNWLRYVLAPLYLNQENNFYPNSYAMHDLGTHFPNATGHVDGNDEYMPVEESGNMIIMAYAIYKLSAQGVGLTFLQQHYPILKQWATYVIEYSLIPAVQLSTDDFAGQLANQTNLAIKGIVGLSAMAQISAAVGDPVNALNYSNTATEYYNNWTSLAIDPSGKHTMLAYQWRSSWGLLYNTYPSKLLGLGIVTQSLFDMQSAYYPTVSQLWGVPLDNRHYYTKSDWEMWTAATCEPSTRRLFVNSIAYWLNTTVSGEPFSDLFETVHEGETVMSPDVIEFVARPVQGGLFSLLALVAAGTY